MFITGSCWKEGKTHLDRFKEHLDGNGGVYIKKLIEDGALKEDFQIELLGTFPLKECLEREIELAKTSLFPKGLNGNAGKFIEMTKEVRQKISESLKGKNHTDEVKQKISESRKRQETY